jgi:hypothetical protein
MAESAPRNELELIDVGEWGRIFGPERLVQIHERQLARHGAQSTIGCSPAETDRDPHFPLRAAFLRLDFKPVTPPRSKLETVFFSI